MRDKKNTPSSIIKCGAFQINIQLDPKALSMSSQKANITTSSVTKEVKDKQYNIGMAASTSKKTVTRHEATDISTTTNKNALPKT
jgi:hypothetical protein